jgi:hypothetical protein
MNEAKKRGRNRKSAVETDVWRLRLRMLMWHRGLDAEGAANLAGLTKGNFQNVANGTNDSPSPRRQIELALLTPIWSSEEDYFPRLREYLRSRGFSPAIASAVSDAVEAGLTFAGRPYFGLCRPPSMEAAKLLEAALDLAGTPVVFATRKHFETALRERLNNLKEKAR